MKGWRLSRLGGLLVLGSAVSSCTYSLDLNRFHHDEVETAIGAVTFADLDMNCKNMTSHLTEYFEVRIVDHNNAIQAKAAYQGVLGPNFGLFLGKVVPKMNGPYRIDFWADHDGSGKYEWTEGGINGRDHAWRRTLDPLPEDIKVVDSRYEFTFQHDTAFVDILTDLEGNKISGAETFLPLHLSIVGATAYVGQTMEFRITDHATGRMTGFWRQGTVAATFPVDLTGILDEETGYDISIYVDANANGRFDTGIDPSWQTNATSNSMGVVISLDMSLLPMGPISTGEPPPLP